MSVNKVILVGNLGRDPEVRYSPDGRAMANVSIATTSVWNDRNTGERREDTEWHRIAFFGRQAEVVAQYLKKGSSIYVEGKLKTRKWTDKDGIERYTTEIIADQMQMLGGRGGQSGQGGGEGPFDERQYQPAGGNFGGGARSGGGYGAQGGGDEFSSPPRQASYGQAAPSKAATPAPAPRPAAPSTNVESFDDMDDDIPF